AVAALRLKQMRTMLSTLLLSQGVPMIQAGDELARSQRGNNNAYCQDNEISWVNWDYMKRHRSLVRFCQALIAFRRSEPTVRQENFLTGTPRRPGGLPDLSWFNPDGHGVDWHRDERSLVCLLAAVLP
ncbi:hypothetical protein QML28_29960, partial [Klebsiella pneumoniae]